MATDTLNTLLEYTRQKDTASIHMALQSLPQAQKGRVCESYIAELYKGNGWLVQITGGTQDRGSDILLYHPKKPSKPTVIVQIKNQTRPLTLDDTRIELIKFEQQATPLHGCQQFNLISVSGFVKDAEKLGDFNMLLSDWGYIASLIERYSPRNITEPEINLYAHNKKAYENVKELWQQNKQVAVVQATGTGKSYIIAKVLADFLADNKLMMAPSKYILKQQKDVAGWAASSTRFMTYAKVAKLREATISKLDVSLVVLDEFHRCGAQIWGAGVQRILSTYPDALVLGTSATPIRYLDSSRDMSDELFGGRVAANLSLADAIMRNILPAPEYIAALYTLEEETNELLAELDKSNKSDEEKKRIAAEIQAAKFDWERTSGIPQILKKHLKHGINKFIVFCKDQQHLDEMEPEVQKWFQKAGTHRWRKVYHVVSADPDSDKNLKEFREANSKNTAHLLFAIDMFNEGLHIPDVGSVILLRPTESPIVFYQQIGRCIQVGGDHTPIIFDFVNNFRNIRASDFLNDLKEAKDRERQKRAALGLNEYVPVIHISDETKDIRNLLEQISEKLQPWEVMFQQLVEYKEAHGHCDVPNKWSENYRLGRWVGRQRWWYRNGNLGNNRILRLKEIGFIWGTPTKAWEERFAELIQFKSQHGHCNISRNWHDNPSLSWWVVQQRQLYRKGKLNEDRIRCLEKIGFIWDTRDKAWEVRFAELVKFKSQHGHCDVPTKYAENSRLAKWVVKQRTCYREGKLDEDRIRRLEEIGFHWEPYGDVWEEMFDELLRFKSMYGHCRIPRKWTENPKFANWISTQRMKRSTLDESRIRRMEEIGFIWEPFSHDWEEMFDELLRFKSMYGHCRVPHKWTENPKFANWISHQRQFHTDGTLNESRIRRLEEIGFIWDTPDAVWEERFAELVKFKSQRGHCDVPAKYIEKPKLGTWVRHQRQFHRDGKLNKSHIRRLEEIGFKWQLR